MLFDSHMHSNFSFDSKMKPSEIITRSNEENIGTIITDHIDLNLSFIPIIDINVFKNYYSKLRNDKFLIGLEIGLYNNDTASFFKFIEDNCTDSLDFILGSIHTINDIDLYESVRKEKRDKITAYGEYLKTMLTAIKKFDFFDSLAHIDYICRYAPYEDSELYLNDFKNEFKEIFTYLIKENKLIELNTNRLGNKESFNALVEIYSYYESLGGKYITIGSDAHKKEDIARNFNLLENFLNKTNLKAAYFKNRKLIIIE